jgi:hypothetical protein
MASGYLFSRTQNAGNMTIDALISHHYVDGKEHGKRKGRAGFSTSGLLRMAWRGNSKN